MTDNLHHSRQAAAQAEAEESLVEMLVAHIEQAYDTGGQPGASTALRKLFRSLDPAVRTGLVYQLELETEPAEDEMGDQR
ncbi:MAG TPA: hypothetical protein VMJ30_07970 [Gemmatimonadales bacterium]|nr:hypothetical protein [Gemmatimonadales bacterium]